MTTILRTSTDKDRALFVLSKIIEEFFFNQVDPHHLSAIAQHITWMKRQTEDLKVNARFETFPSTASTRIILDFSSAHSVEPLKQN